MKEFTNNIFYDPSELQKVHSSILKTNTLLAFHLFMKTKSGNYILLLKAGEVLLEDFVEKYQSLNLFCQPVFSSDFELELNRVVDLLSLADNEVQRQEAAEELLFNALRVFKQGEESVFVVAKVFFEKLYRLPHKLMVEQYLRNSLIHQRSLLTGAIAVVMALADGHCDPEFLKDIFTAAFHLDHGILEEEPCHYLISACERERTSGSGRAYLRGIDHKRLKVFENHPAASYEFLLGHKLFFKNTGALEAVKFHHENEEGKGFPYAKVYEDMPPRAIYLQLADNIVPFERVDFCSGDNVKFIFELRELYDKFDYQLVKKLSNALNAIEDSAA